MYPALISKARNGSRGSFPSSSFNNSYFPVCCIKEQEEQLILDTADHWFLDPILQLVHPYLVVSIVASTPPGLARSNLWKPRHADVKCLKWEPDSKFHVIITAQLKVPTPHLLQVGELCLVKFILLLSWFQLAAQSIQTPMLPSIFQWKSK